MDKILLVLSINSFSYLFFFSKLTRYHLYFQKISFTYLLSKLSNDDWRFQEFPSITCIKKKQDITCGFKTLLHLNAVKIHLFHSTHSSTCGMLVEGILCQIIRRISSFHKIPRGCLRCLVTSRWKTKTDDMPSATLEPAASSVSTGKSGTEVIIHASARWKLF